MNSFDMISSNKNDSENSANKNIPDKIIDESQIKNNTEDSQKMRSFSIFIILN